MNIFANQLKQIGLLPVVTVHSVDEALSLARILATSGFPCMEITCRTACAIDAIKAVRQSEFNVLLGAGTVTNTELLAQLAPTGVDFVVSPGTTVSLLQAATDHELTILPGVSSASEIMLCMDYGLKYMKLFPAVPINALALLDSFYGPFPEAQFCPTGGINAGNLQEFIRLPNVFCVGGSWLGPKQHAGNSEWDKITKLCKKVA